MATAAKTYKKDLTKTRTPKEFKVTLVLRTNPDRYNAGYYDTAEKVGDNLAGTYVWGDLGLTVQTVEVQDITTA